jgi:hypothetical protein
VVDGLGAAALDFEALATEVLVTIALDEKAPHSSRVSAATALQKRDQERLEPPTGLEGRSNLEVAAMLLGLDGWLLDVDEEAGTGTVQRMAEPEPSGIRSSG